jgi:hypothetical protein
LLLDKTDPPPGWVTAPDFLLAERVSQAAISSPA